VEVHADVRNFVCIILIDDGNLTMTRYECALLIGLAEEIILQLRTRLTEIENLHPRESALGIATFQERLRNIEDLLDCVKKDRESCV
jgi:hypothetical protein